MNPDTSSSHIGLTLKIDTKQLDAFCNKIISRSRNIANVHEALNVLEAFVSTFSSDSQGSDNYQAIQDCLKAHSAKTRDKLMHEKMLQLQQGLEQHNITLLADIYSSLSRNGFYQILNNAAELIERNNIPEIAHWIISWSEDAKQKAEQASGYPDALDFKKADIKIEEFQAMSDISYFFNNTYQ
ncbi:MAG: hypothetical protein KZQ70_02795 [gamma proteobacterium symbiont of Lucinoma myriamae]|nr:hypothetical protein [gamma proteobacterium symbiont of Lucinoma myriamae]MCU7819272.1 hypothetical protein [gamma proteobacterium symbiont of Lucinoma myriamae]MCU7831523.1 hypothetical protein [gamma proteobacterium symbiont of Lucinoma myriamae]